MAKTLNAREELGTGRISSLIVRFSVPSIAAMLVSSLYNIVDQYFIGQSIGELGNAATNISYPLSILCTAVALMFGVGGAASFNLTMGRAQNHPDEAVHAPHYIGKAMLMLVMCGTAITAVTLIFLRPLLIAFGSPANVLGYAEEYAGIVALGFPFLVFSTGTAHLIRADGRPTSAMLCNIAGAVFNTILDAWFVFGLSLGMAGAAWATVIGQVCSGTTAGILMHRARTVRVERRHIFGSMSKYTGRMAAIGMAPTINQLAMMVVSIVMNNSFRYYGAQSPYGEAIPIAVSGIISKVNMIFMSFVIGMSQGMQPIVSYNYGAENYARTKKTYLTACGAGFGVSAVFFALFQLMPRQIISIFGAGSEEYYQFATAYFRIYLFFTFLNFLQPLTSNLFTAIGMPGRGALLALSRQIILLLPLMLLLPLYMGIDGILYAGPAADFGAAAVSAVTVWRELRKPKYSMPENAQGI